jgi:hypothetical protein
MSTFRPVHVGSDPDRDPPETLLEVSVQVEHRRDLDPREMEGVVRQVAERLDAALEESRFDDLPVQRVRTDSFLAAGERGPLWPLHMGNAAVFTCPADVVEALERMCAGTDLAELAFDLLGRAYELHLGIHLTRAPGADRDGVAAGDPAHQAA